MKVLITGGAGYIGSMLTPMLLKDGHTVTVLDNMMYHQTPLLDSCWNQNLNIIRGDVRDPELLKKLVSQNDVLIPLACLTGAPACAKDPQAAVAIGRDAVVDMCKLKSKSQALIYPCTNSGYGIGQEGLECDEDSPLQPVSLYGRLKVEAEKALLDSGEAVTFRFATVFGASPRMRLDLLVNDFTYRAVNDRFVVLFEPHFKRNYLHVMDAANAFRHAMQNYESMKGRPYNVGLSDANLSKMELCETIQKHVPEFQILVSEVGQDPDKRNYVISNKRIEATGFKTKHSLSHGIQELLKCYQIIKRTEHSNI
ncbi:MAG: NAD-dependent epimerase/dehydratase family protein [Bdellovibrionales bacterium]